MQFRTNILAFVMRSEKEAKISAKNSLRFTSANWSQNNDKLRDSRARPGFGEQHSGNSAPYQYEKYVSKYQTSGR